VVFPRGRPPHSVMWGGVYNPPFGKHFFMGAVGALALVSKFFPYCPLRKILGPFWFQGPL